MREALDALAKPTHQDRVALHAQRKTRELEVMAEWVGAR
jgi:hypothetical protein